MNASNDTQQNTVVLGSKVLNISQVKTAKSSRRENRSLFDQVRFHCGNVKKQPLNWSKQLRQHIYVLIKVIHRVAFGWFYVKYAETSKYD